MDATGVEMRFRPQGRGRYFTAGFLGLWLCGWAAGEVAALVALGTGVFAFLTGNDVPGLRERPSLGMILGIGAFLLLWLSFWTIGGVMAMRELLRAFWAEDRLVLEPDALVVSRRLGPFRSVRRFPRESLRRVFFASSRGRSEALRVELENRVEILTDLGTPEERHTAREALEATLGRRGDSPANSAPPEPPADLPAGWEQRTTPWGEVVVAPSARTRRQQAWAAAIVAGVLGVAGLALGLRARQETNSFGLAAICTVAAVGLGWQAWRLFEGGIEWRIEPGRLVRQRRAGGRARVLVEARALELHETTDSDGDRWYELRATALTSPARAGGNSDPRGKAHVRITTSIHDPTVPRRLGQWLADRARVPWRDLVPDEAARRADIHRLCERLAGTGRWGRAIARRLDPGTNADPPRES